MRAITTFFTLVIFCLTFNANGQILNKLKNVSKDGVQDSVEQRVAHEMQKAAQKQADRYLTELFGPPTEYEGSGYDYSAIMQSIQTNVEHADSYDFTGHTDMEIGGTDKKGKAVDPVVFRSFHNTDAETWAMEMETDEKNLERTIMIFDNSHQATIMLMEDKKGEKSRMAYSMDWNAMMSAAMENDTIQESMESLEITKTGNTKSIMGYTCDEYKTENEDMLAYYWVSQEPIDGYASYWSKNNFMFNQQMKSKYSDYYNKLPDGDVLEITYTDKNSKETTSMKIVDINTSTAHNFTMADYNNIMAEVQQE